MKCSDDILLHALLLITFARGLGSTKLYLDEVIDDVIEKLFGSAVQDEFAELTLNCPDALMALKKAGDCISNKDLSYHRISQQPPDAKSLCDDLSAAGECLESVIEALKSCAGEREVQRKTLEAVGEGMNAALRYFCEDKATKLIQLYKEGFPRCFIRRPGRQLARCFPGRSEHASNPNYWEAVDDKHFFHPKNCELLRNHTDCAVRTLEQCQFGSRDVSAFRGAIQTVMDNVMCSDQSESPQGSRGGAGITLPAIPWSWLFTIIFIALPILSSWAGATPRP